MEALNNVIRPSGISAQFTIRLNGIKLCAGLNYASFCTVLFSIMQLCRSLLIINLGSGKIRLIAQI